MRKEHDHRKAVRARIGNGSSVPFERVLWNMVPPNLPFYVFAGSVLPIARANEHLGELFHSLGQYKIVAFWALKIYGLGFRWKRIRQEMMPNEDDCMFPLERWLSSSRSLTRDRMYALLSMSQDREAIKVDYSRHTSDADIYTAVASYFLENSGDLSHLMAVRYKLLRRMKGLPSWVLDISDHENPRCDSERSFADGGKWTWLRLCPPRPNSMRSLKQLFCNFPRWFDAEITAQSNIRFESDQKSIVLQGLRVGTIDQRHHGGGVKFDPDRDDTPTLWESLWHDLKWTSSFLKWHCSALQHPRTALRYDRPYEAFWRTMVFDQAAGDASRQKPAPETIRIGYELATAVVLVGARGEVIDYYESMQPGQKQCLSIFMGQATKSASRRAFITTKCG